MTEIPMNVVNKFKVWKCKFFLNHSREFGLYWLCPLTHKDNKLVDIPSDTTKVEDPLFALP